MQNSKITYCDAGSSRDKINMISMKNRLKILAASALLLAATKALATIVSLPASGVFLYPENAPVTVQDNGTGSIVIRTTGLNGEMTIKGSDFPLEYEVPASASGKLLISQELELVINLSLGVVEGRAGGQYINSTELWDWRFHADVRGNANCLPLNGRDCGQLVVDLELQGVLTDPNDPSIVGQLRKKMLGSLVVDSADFGVWVAMSANATIGGNEGLINEFAVDIAGQPDIFPVK